MWVNNWDRAAMLNPSGGYRHSRLKETVLGSHASNASVHDCADADVPLTFY